MRLQFIPIHIFRETPSVTFSMREFQRAMEPMSSRTVELPFHSLMTMVVSSTTYINTRWATT